MIHNDWQWQQTEEDIQASFSEEDRDYGYTFFKHLLWLELEQWQHQDVAILLLNNKQGYYTGDKGEKTTFLE